MYCFSLDDSDAEGFPVYKIEGLEFEGEKIRKQKSPGITPAPPRFRTMSPDQDWTDVWPTEATFKWSVVPFPVRQGFVKVSCNHPDHPFSNIACYLT